MHKRYPQPVIIGAGLSGLLISLALTKARIGHILIGGPPPADGPRLGESLGLEATLYFLAEYPELADCYYEKRFAVAYGGDLGSYFDFTLLRSRQFADPLEVWGKQAPRAALHVDRVRADAAFYVKAINSPFCTHVDAQVTDVLYQAETDRIQAIHLADGTHIPVSHVFDATGHIRLLARALNIPCQVLSEPQRVAFVHYYTDEQHKPDMPQKQYHSTPVVRQPQANAWHPGTSIARLSQEQFGIDGLAWCIPLGKTISVGISTSWAHQQLSDEMLLHYAQEIFARYEIDYSTWVDQHSRIGSARMEFYTHANAYGANWLLVAAAHSQIWWPTATGLDSAVAAAQAAIRFLHNPQQIGAQYQTYLASLAQSHTVWNWLATYRHGELTETKIAEINSQLTWSTIYRLLMSFAMEERSRLGHKAAAFAAQTYGLNLWPRMPTPHSIRRVPQRAQ